jgi:nucleotide-binding universal stress UspA family protein
MEALRHVLVGTDFSEDSQAALLAGRDLARASGAKLTLMHVYPPGMQALGAAGMDENMALGHDVHEALGRLKDKVTGVVDVHVALVADTMPAAVLLDYASANGVDLIVLGAHGHGAARRFLLGSVADRVARHAHCSVLIAR